jgi:hypothetical protein
MKEMSENNFGVIIAFLLPGFLLLWGLSISFESIARLLASSTDKDAPSVGGFLYATLASLSLGLLLSAARWLIVDHLLVLFGVIDPGLNYENLKDKDRYAAFLGVVENHYSYYQYYSNTLVAIIIAFAAHVVFGKQPATISVWIVVIAVSVALFLGARDSLKKYYTRAQLVLK